VTTKTTDLWLSRDPDGTYCVSEAKPERNDEEDWEWFPEGRWWQPDLISVPALRKGTKRRIRVTVEVLR